MHGGIYQKNKYFNFVKNLKNQIDSLKKQDDCLLIYTFAHYNDHAAGHSIVGNLSPQRENPCWDGKDAQQLLKLDID